MTIIQKIINSLKKLINNNFFFDMLAGAILLFAFGIVVFSFLNLIIKMSNERSPWTMPENICVQSHNEEYWVKVRIGVPRQNLWENEKRTKVVCDEYSSHLYIQNKINNKLYELVPRD